MRAVASFEAAVDLYRTRSVAADQERRSRARRMCSPRREPWAQVIWTRREGSASCLLAIDQSGRLTLDGSLEQRLARVLQCRYHVLSHLVDQTLSPEWIAHVVVDDTDVLQIERNIFLIR